ncbi:methionine--tRNA ligase [Texas Phoenix palm phytoplasma]|uniref:Methionine--tRNA ligase n=1 Tax=Texas Phoenix palm phytoplasma TaxID=176709 RepID=A0ABS5BIL0_9MOLU|nr:methionine--tRNA ligase [Texas Phoenix palm phytoplasma]MBP3059384.1 methionine--tRNA ligase [Texas Phoenix palm phytoplasma]
MNKKDKKKFYISTSIVYASSRPHIGNLYEIILSDVIARFKRMDGYDVYFQTGTDEHGQKIEQKAIQKNFTPKEYVDFFSFEIEKIYKKMNIKYDYFARTTDSFHKNIVQKIVKKFFEQKDVYLGNYEGWYSVFEESYISEKDLIEGKTASGETPIWAKEEVYFFKLSKYQKKFLIFLEKNDNLIFPEKRKKEILNWLKEPLPDLSITRTSFKWGVELDFDPKHVVYVWVDALMNYITGLRYDPTKKKEEQSKKFLKYWPCDLHVIGKDISRFHLVIWPILLIALELPLPKHFLIHPWILFNNKKMSKSINNVIYEKDLLKFFSVDSIRYFVLHEIPYNDDGIITYDIFSQVYNSDLVNTLGNLLSRTIGLISKYRDGKVKKISNFKKECEINLSQKSLETLPIIKKLMKEFKVGESLEKIMQLCRLCNKYIDLNQPWNLIKENKLEDLDFCLYNLIETIRFIGVLLKPFLPDTAEIILKQIKAEKDSFESLNFFGLTKNKKLKKENKLFPRFEKKNFFN